jgi:hypothetical protein
MKEEVKFLAFTVLVITLFISIGVLVYYKIPYLSDDLAIIGIPTLISMILESSSSKHHEKGNERKSKSRFIVAMIFLTIGYIFLSLSMFVSTKTVEDGSGKAKTITVEAGLYYSLNVGDKVDYKGNILGSSKE